jgi:hypothetical protein
VNCSASFSRTIGIIGPGARISTVFTLNLQRPSHQEGLFFA